MIKYQININVKNESHLEGDKTTKPYLINFKYIADTISEALDVFYEKYKNVIRKNEISDEKIAEVTLINKINTEKCPKWESLFLNVKVNECC